MKIFKIGVLLLLGLGFIYAIGPKVTYESPRLLDTQINVSQADLDNFVAQNESKVKDLKSDNQARIIWANDSLKQQTEYSLVYLHGFSASQEEGDPIHTEFAKRYGCNLYLPRLEDHGRIDSNSFENLTPENYIQSAEDAIDIGKILGKKVIVMSCSTGGTLSIILASAGESIQSLILYSPNIDLYDSKSELLLYPWGKQISDLIMGGRYNRISYDSLGKKYWNIAYHTNSLFALKSMIKEFMTEDNFKKINIPVFLGYYYRDEDNQDKVVSVNRMHDFFNQISTPEPLKKKVSFPNAGSHVISSYIMSKDIESVKKATFDWADQVLRLPLSAEK
jgi:esterase/lipase